MDFFYKLKGPPAEGGPLIFGKQGFFDRKNAHRTGVRFLLIRPLAGCRLRPEEAQVYMVSKPKLLSPRGV